MFRLAWSGLHDVSYPGCSFPSVLCGHRAALVRRVWERKHVYVTQEQEYERNNAVQDVRAPERHRRKRFSFGAAHKHSYANVFGTTQWHTASAFLGSHDWTSLNTCDSEHASVIVSCVADTVALSLIFGNSNFSMPPFVFPPDPPPSCGL